MNRSVRATIVLGLTLAVFGFCLAQPAGAARTIKIPKDSTIDLPIFPLDTSLEPLAVTHCLKHFSVTYSKGKKIFTFDKKSCCAHHPCSHRLVKYQSKYAIKYSEGGQGKGLGFSTAWVRAQHRLTRLSLGRDVLAKRKLLEQVAANKATLTSWKLTVYFSYDSKGQCRKHPPRWGPGQEKRWDKPFGGCTTVVPRGTVFLILKNPKKARNMTAAGAARGWTASRILRYFDVNPGVSADVVDCEQCDIVPKKNGTTLPTKPIKEPKKVGYLIPGFNPSGRNYGAVGNVGYVNYGDDAETAVLEDGSYVTTDGEDQDFVVTNVPTQGDPPAGATALGVALPVPSETIVVVKDAPGICADGEKDPPAAGTPGYTIEEPNDKSLAVVDVVDTISKIDFSKKPLKGMTPEQAKETACQAAAWQVESQIDEVDGNEISDEELTERFFATYVTATAEARKKMTAKQRKEMDGIVRDDLKTVVNSIDFVTKKHADKQLVSDAVSLGA